MTPDPVAELRRRLEAANDDRSNMLSFGIISYQVAIDAISLLSSQSQEGWVVFSKESPKINRCCYITADDGLVYIAEWHEHCFVTDQNVVAWKYAPLVAPYTSAGEGVS